MRSCLSDLALALLLVLLLLALLALGLLGLVALFGFGSGLFCLHLLAFRLDAEFFVDARLEEGTELLGIAADKGRILKSSLKTIKSAR